MLATNRYANVDSKLDTQLLEGIRKDNDIGNYQYYDEEDESGTVEAREITDSVARNLVGKDKTDFGETTVEGAINSQGQIESSLDQPTMCMLYRPHKLMVNVAITP